MHPPYNVGGAFVPRWVRSIADRRTKAAPTLGARAPERLYVVEDLAGEVVAVAADVAEFPEVIAEDDLGAFGHAAEGAADRGAGGVVDEDEDRPDLHRAGADFAEAKGRAGADGNSSGLHLIGQHLAAVELADKVAVALKGEFLLRGEEVITRISVREARGEGGARAAVVADVDVAGRDAVAAEGAGAHGDVAGAGLRAVAVSLEQERAGAHGRAAGVGVSAAEGERAGANLGQRSARQRRIDRGARSKRCRGFRWKSWCSSRSRPP